jgi:electron transfer flavoprotein alpha subunit
MSVNNSVVVFIEQKNKKIADVSLELLCKARELAENIGGTTDAIVIGHDMKEELGILGKYGCRKAYYVDDRRLAHFTSVPYAKTIVEITKKYKPTIVLFGASTTGRDVAPRVASELKCGLTADCTDLKIGDHKIKDRLYKNVLLQIRPAFGGNIIATIVSPESTPSMATVREGVMKIETLDSSTPVEIVDEDCLIPDDDFMTEIIEVVNKEKTVDLKSAQVIVSAGMGACSPESLVLVKELARVLGGEVGASRPAVDGGFLVKDHQVGQTGTTVRPTLYIACGISGQIQHRAGMAESKRIIAINNDPQAPIFDIAHYGIVGDLNDIIPKMIKAFKEKV